MRNSFYCLLLNLLISGSAFAQVNVDPNFIKAPGCWGSPSSGHTDDSLCGVKPVPFNWPWHLSWDNTTGVAFPTPLSGYLGTPVTRLRYAPLSEGGMVFQINTYDQLANTTPWRYNFQAFQTNISAAIPLTDPIVTTFDFKVRKDWYHYDATELSPKNVPGELGERRRPWVHLILGGVFSKGDKIWFIEIVPFYREGQYGSGLGGLHGTAPVVNLRLKVTDSRLAGATSPQSVLPLAKRRLYTVDFKKAFKQCFPTESIVGVTYSGSYIGTEQFGREKIAINFKRLAIN
jgi:hypothetical protein